MSASRVVLLIFWFLYFIKTLYETSFDPETSQSMIPIFWLFAFFLCFLPMLPLSTTINLVTINYAKKILFLLAVLVNILSLQKNMKEVSKEILTRFNGNDIINPITYGQTGVVLIILSFSYFMNHNSKYKFIYIIFIGMGLANIGLAASRGPVITLFLILVFYIISNLKNKQIFNFFFLALTLGLLGWYFRGYLFVFDSVIQRLDTTSSDEERNNIIAESWSRFSSSPIIGSNAIGEYAHNIFFGSLEAIGIIGGVLILIIYVNAIKESFALVRIKSTDWIALLVVMQLCAALLSGAIWNGFVLWPVLALSANLYLQRSLYAEKRYV